MSINGPQSCVRQGVVAWEIVLRVCCALILGAGGVIRAAQSEEALRGLFERGATHWSFQPLQESRVPEVQQTAWARNGVDLFILKELEGQDLNPAPEADRESFIRRVTFDLTGLPPTPPEIDSFLADDSPGAHAALVERLLQSPRYGERWGRHWLDLARYAESDGFEHDAVRPHAWRYRDYVVDSFNADKPYDRFILEQLAGDELFPDRRDALVATAFNLLGPDMVDSSDQVQRRLNRLNDMTDTSGLVFLGMTVGCARCHDHMFEPISQTDYYRLQAFFTPSEFHDDLPIPTPEEKAAYDRRLQAFEDRKQSLDDALQTLEAPYRLEWRDAKLAELPEDARAVFAVPQENRTEEQTQTFERFSKTLQMSEEHLQEAMGKEDRRHWDRLRRERKNLAKPIPPPQTMALSRDKDHQGKTHVLFRGDYQNPRDAVFPGAPQILIHNEEAKIRMERRKELAQWIASPANPLTARVMVNRIWQHHFGRGLVPTPSNFGLNGLPPSHPELLDWLAQEFIRTGWSIKAMHRLILLSSTYRQSSHASARTRRIDPSNRWYSRWRPIRLEGEAIRDGLLFISGRLNLVMGGPSVAPPIPRDVFAGAAGWKTSPNPEAHQRRSIYIFNRRNLRFPFLEVFDAPDSNLSCARRGESTTAPQSLTLLNADEVMDACAATARAIDSRGLTRGSAVEIAFRKVLGRNPNPEELRESMEFLESSPLSELCRALFNLNAFVYVD